MLMQQQLNNEQQATESNKPKIIGLDNIDLKDAPKIDLRELEVGQGGYTFTYLGAIQFEGQWGPYYLVGVKDQNGNLFKFFSNSQINKMIDAQEEPFNQVGTTFFVECRMKPGMKYKLKSGEEREAKGYSYDFKVIQ